MNKNTIILIVTSIVVIVGIYFVFIKEVEAPALEQSAPRTTGTTSAVPAPGFEGSVEEMIVNSPTQDSTTESRGADENVTSEESSTPAVTDSTPPVTQTPSSITITYTNDGFSPSSITISKGDTVRFVNESSSSMWVASAVHPTHTLYPLKSDSDCIGSSFDQCAANQNGGVFEYTFTETGSHGYHNHLRASKRGTITVN